MSDDLAKNNGAGRGHAPPQFGTAQENRSASSKENGGENEQNREETLNNVGVGGLFVLKIEIPKKGQKECVLLYKRYKDPDLGKWSLPGGAVRCFESTEQALKRKASERLHKIIDVSRITVNGLIVLVNHINQKENFHYLSPQYYMDIANLSDDFIWTHHRRKAKDKKGKAKTSILLLDTEQQIKKDVSESTKDAPLLALVPVDVIPAMVDSNEYFFKTTIIAIKTYHAQKGRIAEIMKCLEDWRMNGVPEK